METFKAYLETSNRTWHHSTAPNNPSPISKDAWPSRSSDFLVVFLPFGPFFGEESHERSEGKAAVDVAWMPQEHGFRM